MAGGTFSPAFETALQPGNHAAHMQNPVSRLLRACKQPCATGALDSLWPLNAKLQPTAARLSCQPPPARHHKHCIKLKCEGCQKLFESPKLVESIW